MNYRLRMKVLAYKKNKLLKNAIGCSIVISVLYLLFYKSTGLTTNKDASSQSRSAPRINVFPVLLTGMGNFEPVPEPILDKPGEAGRAHILGGVKENKASQAITEFGMNMACSDEIALNRSIPDLRMEECKHWKYPQDLPKTSVIVVFHNEGWSSLLRTVHSVINRTPPQFLEEVLLVDDFSNKEHLKSKLEDYIVQFGEKVRLLRNTEREGLIRTRSRGAHEAKGEVILFLDAHCEVGYNWLPPLLAPIYRDKTTMTVPIIDGIDHNTWEYRTVYEQGQHYRGIFEWGMLYKETLLPDREAKNRVYKSEPYKSPTHAGGLFAMNRQYFLDIGGYDPGLLVWGGENFELSFKLWQCGGSIEWVPCSHVGHVYRSFMPYNFGKLAEKVKGPIITYNYKRVVETWFDEKHKKFFYTREPLAQYLDMGDISKQVALKNRLQCKDFQWYMDNVAYDVLYKFPELPENLYWGELMNVATQKCLDTLGYAAPTIMGLGHCHGYGNNQLMRLNAEGQLGVGERCIQADGQGVKLVVCQLGTVNGHWKYDANTRLMINKKREKCLAVHPKNSHVLLVPCDEKNIYQHWKFKKIIPDWSN